MASTPKGMQRNSAAAGRLAAIALIQEARATDPDHATIEAKYRNGRRQHNFVLPHLLALMDRPLALEGFASVLSDLLATSSGPDVVVYKDAHRLLQRQERADASEACHG